MNIRRWVDNFVINVKHKTLYRVLAHCKNATNAQDGEVGIIYASTKDPSQWYYRAYHEFTDKFVTAYEPGSDARFQKELAKLINMYSIDVKLQTPDYVVAEMIMGHLEAFDIALRCRQDRMKDHPPYLSAGFLLKKMGEDIHVEV